MKVEESIVKKLRISGVDNLDPITAYIENFSDGVGKITIEVFGDCWSHFWSAMGEGRSLESFFLSASNDYLIGKLSPQLDREITNYDELDKAFKKELLKLRREGHVSKEDARSLWEKIEDEVENCEGWLQTPEGNSIAYDILGDEWWYCLPKEPNSEYQYLKRIINTIKEALIDGE